MKTPTLIRAVLSCAFLLSASFSFGDEAVARCHQVNAEVGLVIRSKPGTDGKRLGSVEHRAKVMLAGKVAPDDKSKVIPVVSKDAKDPDASWVQITGPKAGYVLYRTGGSSPYDYLVPCTK